MNNPAPAKRPRSQAASSLYELLSSMRFAIALLTVLALASVIGTLLQQNQPFNNYLNQFGPFWFPMFKMLGLYNVYSTGWFLAILAFLLLSTGLCIVRHARPMLHDMRTFRETAREASLRAFHLRAEGHTPLDAGTAVARTREYLAVNGFRTRENPRNGDLLIAAKQGSWSRAGYFLAHGAIILICVGGLLDGNLPLKLRMALGNKQVLHGEVSDVSQVPPTSRLTEGNATFRGNVFIPEGKSASVAVLNVDDGMLLQDLPFIVSLDKFHVDFYPTGQPKRFASDVIITDRDNGKSFRHTIEVNKPLTYRGVTLYQASFEDGGSRLRLAVHSLVPGEAEEEGGHHTNHDDHGGIPEARLVEAVINEALPLAYDGQQYTAEFSDFRPFNVETVGEQPSTATGLARLEQHLGSGAKSPTERTMKNVGPSFTYRLRDASGQAREYINYMVPTEQDGRWYALAGMRESPDQPFRFLRIPTDEASTVNAWFALRNVLLDPKLRAEVAKRYASGAQQRESLKPDSAQRLEETAQRTLQLFSEQGFDSLGGFIEKTVPQADRENVASALLKVMEGTTWEAWMLARERAGEKPVEPTAQRVQFVRDSLASVSDSMHYGSPVYLQLVSFEQVQATVLQATRSPGKPLVYLGSLLLVLGVFAMLYVRERRLFILLKADGRILMALSTNRQGLDAGEQFARHRDALMNHLDATAAQRDEPQ
ncbi:MAG: cytochrome c biogenesis protein ResB [Rhodocyclaceae bacterium]